MKIKVSEATPPQLDWMAAKANGIPLCLSPFTGSKQFVLVGQNGKPTSHTYEPTTSWAQGGPIIEREKIGINFTLFEGWIAETDAHPTSDHHMRGSTPLIVAMRCYVSSKLGEEVDVPEELT